jgi:hypothetical protein
MDHLGYGHAAEEANVKVFVEHLVGKALSIKHGAGSVDARELADFVRHFAAAAARYEPHSRPLLAYVGPFRSVSPVPIDDVALMCVHWWGYVSPLDTLVVVDEALKESRVVGDAEAIAELAGWDLELAESLAVAWGDTDVLKRLVEHDASTPEDWSLLNAASLASSLVRTTEPPVDMLDAWARGSVNWWGGRALVHINRYPRSDIEAAVAHRIWRGQVAAVLPYVEIARERLVGWISARSHLVGGKWRYNDIAALEVGPIEKVFHESTGLRRSSPHYELARLLRQTRHRLAHLKHVDRDELSRIQKLMSEGLFS